jgi:hypothetical protein
VARYCRPRPGLVGQNQNATDKIGPPTQLRGDGHRHHTALSIHRREQFLNVDDLRLHFDDHQRADPGRPCQDVDGPALATHVQGILDSDLPSETPQFGHNQPSQQGVPFVEQPRQFGAAPSRLYRQPYV